MIAFAHDRDKSSARGVICLTFSYETSAITGQRYHPDPCHLCNLSRRSLGKGGFAVLESDLIFFIQGLRYKHQCQGSRSTFASWHLIRSFPTHSPAARAGLTVHPNGSRSLVFSFQLSAVSFSDDLLVDSFLHAYRLFPRQL